MFPIKNLLEITGLKALFEQPDPKRYQAFARETMPVNWHGSDIAKPRQRSGAVLVNEDTMTFEFPESKEDLKTLLVPYLTEMEKVLISGKGYDVTNPKYTEAKQYFAKMGADVTGRDIARICGFSEHTAKDIIAAFRRQAFGSVASPSPSP